MDPKTIKNKTPLKMSNSLDDVVKTLQEKSKIEAYLHFHRKVEEIKSKLKNSDVTIEEARELLNTADLNYQKQISG